jgi:hypothetical protein
MKVDVVRRESISRIKDVKKCETAQTRWNQRRRRSLAASYEKVAPTTI